MRYPVLALIAGLVLSTPACGGTAPSTQQRAGERAAPASGIADYTGAHFAFVAKGEPRIPIPLASDALGDVVMDAIEREGANPFLDELPDEASREAAVTALLDRAGADASLKLGATWTFLTPSGPIARRVVRHAVKDIGTAALHLVFEALPPTVTPFPKHPDRGALTALWSHADEGSNPAPTLATPASLPADVRWAPVAPWSPPGAAAAWGPTLAKALDNLVRPPNAIAFHLAQGSMASATASGWQASAPGARAAIAVVTVPDGDIEPAERIACAWLSSAPVWVDAAGAFIERVAPQSSGADLGCAEVLFRVTRPGQPDAVAFEQPVWTMTEATLVSWDGATPRYTPLYEHSFE